MVFSTQKLSARGEKLFFDSFWTKEKQNSTPKNLECSLYLHREFKLLLII